MAKKEEDEKTEEAGEILRIQYNMHFLAASSLFSSNDTFLWLRKWWAG
jgi:hypothetical protein